MTKNSKKCSKCKEYYTYDSFHKRRKSPDGYQAYCVFCNKIVSKTFQKRKYHEEKGRFEQNSSEKDLKQPKVVKRKLEKVFLKYGLNPK